MCHCKTLNQFSSRATDIPVCALLALKLLWIIFVVVRKFLFTFGSFFYLCNKCLLNIYCLSGAPSMGLTRQFLSLKHPQLCGREKTSV